MYFYNNTVTTVVNCFQFVFLREESQVIMNWRKIITCCELLSICIFAWGITSDNKTIAVTIMLWIAFNLYFCVRNHKWSWKFYNGTLVVNCFQFVFLREESQVIEKAKKIQECCELLSICIFAWGITRDVSINFSLLLLWIAFNLYFCVRNHKMRLNLMLWICVVNCFQFVFLREESQGYCLSELWKLCCELLSICIFAWGITRWCVDNPLIEVLWIAFNLYFCVRNHKKKQ